MIKRQLIYDIGMNNGDDTAYYLSKGFDVIAVEADPVMARRAETLFAEDIGSGRLKILNVGVAPEEGVMDFYINEVKPEWNSFDKSIASRDGLPYHQEKIKTVRFDSILKEHGIPFYLKADIEGYDYLCIAALEKNRLPLYISVEANYKEMLSELAAKGYTRFKLIYQYNLASLEIPQDKYFKCWLKAYYLRIWNSFPIKVFRKLGGTHFIHWLDRKAIPRQNRHFKKGSSGPFGEETPGAWHTLQQAEKIYDYYNDLFHHLPDKKIYGFWVDIHAGY